MQKQQYLVFKAAAILTCSGRQCGKHLTDHQVQWCLGLEKSAMSTAQSTAIPGSLLAPDVLTPGRPTQLWVHGPLEIVTYPYHTNHLSSLTVTWCANHTVMSISVSVTFPHDTPTHSFLCLFLPHIYLAGQPACWDIPYIRIACQIKLYHCCPARRFCILCWPASHRLYTSSRMVATPGDSILSSLASQAASFNFTKPQNGSLQAQSWGSMFWSDF